MEFVIVTLFAALFLVLVAFIISGITMAVNHHYCGMIDDKMESINRAIAPRELSAIVYRGCSPSDVEWTTVEGAEVGLSSYKMWRLLNSGKSVDEVHRVLMEVHEKNVAEERARQEFKMRD